MIHTPKRAFIRGLFGIQDPQSKGHSARQRASVESDIRKVSERESPFNLQYTTYVFGKENEQKLLDLGCRDVRLLDARPYVFAREHLFRNKMEMINVAMQEHDEIIWVDWDCNIVSAIPEKFWERMYAKEIVQACLHGYTRRVCHWRKSDQRKVANTGFLYIRDRGLMPEVLKAWETTGRRGNDEVAFSFTIDSLMGGWKDVATYYKRFEPLFCDTRSGGPYSNDLVHDKEICFLHHFGRIHQRLKRLRLQQRAESVGILQMPETSVSLNQATD